ncbi:hypothetical protein FQA39_LY02687 [Lamprigera yunnana]|nr:hypothetical protein FQA39_LY02687 [Lamprigera yunnana]
MKSTYALTDIQVHNREVYLKYFIESLRNAKDIESVLLIFSHDYIDEKINKLIANITFCKYMQIFYPYSTQLHPNVFPGPDEKDKETGRNATTMQMKHHWWWKVNKVFHFLSTTDYDGLVLLLEEDFYMVKDFIPTLKLMQETARKSCDSCELFSLALNEHSVNVDMAQENKANHIRKSNRISNMGISLTASSWKKIVSQKKCFCEYDDYNWDFTLQYLFSKCLNDADTMQLMYPRVIHIGACGAHFTSDNCDPVPIINKMHNKLKKVDELLFPGKLEEDRSVRSFYNSARNGGWNDRRDQELCLNMTNY